MGFEFPPDDDPHEECRHEIHSLQSEIERLRRSDKWRQEIEARLDELFLQVIPDADIHGGHAVDRITVLSMRFDDRQREIERLRAIVQRAYRVMSFHTGQCLLQPLINYSGTYRHLAEYRQVMQEAKEICHDPSGAGGGDVT